MKYLTNSGLSYFFNKIKAYLTSSTYLNSIGISNSDIDDIADDAGYSSGSLPASEDIFITGDIIPNTDNSVDLGASSKNIKMIYTEGITINGTQFLPSDYIPKAGGAVITGTNIGRADNTGGLDICGGTTFENGGFVALHGKNTNVTGQEGAVVIGTNNGSSSCNLTLLPNGTATWGNKEIDTIEEQGDGYIRYSNGLQICTGRVYVGNTGGAPRNFTLTFAKSFTVPPVVTVGIVGANSGERKGGVEAVSDTSCSGFVWTTADSIIHMIAIGRWK